VIDWLSCVTELCRDDLQDKSVYSNVAKRYRGLEIGES